MNSNNQPNRGAKAPHEASPPRVIYLQWYDEKAYIDGVTWNDDKIFNNDIKYIRYSEFVRIKTKLETAEINNRTQKDFIKFLMKGRCCNE